MSDLPTGPGAIETAPVPETLAPTPTSAGPDRIAVLRAAGMPDDQISAWAQQKRGILTAAGASQQQIDDYLGNRQPNLSPAFFDRAVKGASLRPDTQPSMLGEFYRGAVRSGASALYSVEKLANIIETKLGQVTGSEAIKRTAAEDVAALAKREAETQAENAPGVPAVSDVGGASGAGHYVLGKLGELAPTVAEYLTMGVPRMIVLGALSGGVRAAEENNGDAGAVATGAAIGAAAAGAPAPFLSGAMGKGLLQGIVKGIGGMGMIGAAQTLAEPLPKAAATGKYEAPSLGQVAEGAASGAVAGAVFGGIGGFARRAPLPNGDLHDQPIGTMPTSDDFANAARNLTGDTPAPHVNAKLSQLWDEHGIHPAEVAHDAMSDPVVKQQLLSSEGLPERYVGPADKLQRIDELTADRLAAERGDMAAGSPSRPFAAIAADEGRAPVSFVENTEAQYPPEAGDRHSFNLVQSEQKIGSAVVEFEGKTAHISDIYVGHEQNDFYGGSESANVLGPRQVRRLARDFLAAHPDIDQISGFRMSGAGNEREITIVRNRLMGAAEGGGGGAGKPPVEPPSVPTGGEPPSPSDAQKAILSRLSVGESDNGRPWSWSRFYTAMVDRLNPIREATQKATAGEPLAPGDDPYKLARLYAGVSGKADRWLNYSTFDFNNYRDTGQSLKQILDPIKNDLDGFRAYGTSLRAIELEDRGIKTGMDIGAAKVVADAGTEKYAPIMKSLVAYQDKLAAYLKDAGVLSPDGYDAMREANPLYLPFQRVFGDNLGDVIPETKGIAGASLQAQNPIHRILGSERRVIDPLESVIRNTYLSIAMAERNAVGTKLVNLLDKAGDIKPVDGHQDTVTILRDGQKETRLVNSDLAAAMKGLDEEAANTMLRLLGAPARMLRAGATLTPDFMARNLIRDLSTAFINTSKSIFTPLDTAKGLYSAATKDKYFQDWLAGGGANAALVSLDRRYLQQNLQKLTAETGLMSRSWNVVRHPIDTLRIVSELSEHATRLGEFRAVQAAELAQGASAKEAAQTAAYSSREVTLDFARRGAATKSVNMITAFWNAQVQGVDRLARAIKDNPTGTALKIAGGITLPSMLLWWANHDDPRWKEIPDWERDLFWLVMTGTPDNGHIFRIPKPFEIGVLFGSGMERTLDAFFGQEPTRFGKFSQSVVSALMPGAIPTAALPVVEQWANRSSFTDRTLIPDTLEKQLPEYQYTPYTTELSKALGQLLSAAPGVQAAAIDPSGVGGSVARTATSPILMENYVRAWTGGLGVYALQLTDASLRKSGLLPDPPKPDDTLADIPVIKAFVVRYPSGGGQSIQDFYDEYKRRKTYLDTFKAQAQQGNVEALSRIQEAGGMSMFATMEGVHKALGMQAQMVRNVWKDPDMPSAEKRQRIDETYTGMLETAQAGMQAMRATAGP